MQIVRVFALFLCSLVFFVSSLVIVIGFSADQIFKAKTITNVLKTYELYAPLEKMVQSNSQGVVVTDIEENGVEATINRILNNFFGYVRGETDTLELTLEVDTSQIRAMFIAKAEEFQICPEGQEPYVQGKPVCRPANVPANVFVSEVLEREGIALPQDGTMNLQDIYDSENKYEEFRVAYLKAKQVWTYVALGSLVLISIMFFLTKRSVRSILRWIGVPVLCVGVLLLIVSIFAPTAIVPVLPPETLAYRTYILEVLTMIFNMVTRNAQVTSITGVVLIGISFALPRKHRVKPLPPPPQLAETDHQ